MLRELDRLSLAYRRRTAQLGMLYKINSGPAAAAAPKSPAYPHLNFREETLPCRLSPQLILPRDSEGMEHAPCRDGLSPLPWRLRVESVRASVDVYPLTPPAILLKLSAVFMRFGSSSSVLSEFHSFSSVFRRLDFWCTVRLIDFSTR